MEQLGVWVQVKSGIRTIERRLHRTKYPFPDGSHSRHSTGKDGRGQSKKTEPRGMASNLNGNGEIVGTELVVASTLRVHTRTHFRASRGSAARYQARIMNLIDQGTVAYF